MRSEGGVRLTPEQEDLRAAVRGLLDRYPVAPEADDSAERGLWRRLCAEIGVAGLAIPERFGGAGAGPVEVHVVMEELGRSLTPAPLLGSAVLATQALLASGDEAACQRLLPALAEGSQTAALAWTTAAGRWDPNEVACQAAATTTGTDGWAVTGEAHFVLDGDVASVLLVPALMPDGETCLFEINPAQLRVMRTRSTSVDQSRRLSVVRLSGAAGVRIGARVDLEPARTAGCIALSAEQVGAAAAALALTVAYAKVRVQFGRPIGSFQALQHRMAEMHVLVGSARSLSYAAAEAAHSGAADTALRAATAKAYCSEVLGQVTSEMIQLHGAIGMTWEHAAHRYFKRGHGAAFLLGAPAGHIDRVAAAVVGS
ncbi:MAG TPA: acyl-CoA dehydrogenase family protein [Streptosporangiaceae bacterium]|nr:acyl-CoA dehydrogenase family protein [Streptosporangiaceae bacterium]